MAMCGVCSDAITAIPDSIACYNKACNVVYHLRCAGLSRTKITMITEMENLHYYCNDCCKVMVSFDSTDASVVPDNPAAPVHDVSSQLECIKETLSILTEALITKPDSLSIRPPTKAPKRRRLEDDQAADDVDSGETVMPFPRYSRQQSSMVVGSASDSDGLLVVEPRKELVASMLHPSTESDQLADFIKSKLSITTQSTEIRVRKLVAADKDISTLDYVSFKVSVSGAHFKELMSPTMWPIGVRVREFQYRPRKSRPAAVFLPQKESIVALPEEPGAI